MVSRLAILLLAAALCASAAALTPCEQRCRASHDYAPVCGAWREGRRVRTKAFPNSCVYRCELGGDDSAWITATGITQDPKCRRQYNAVGWMTGMCLDCQEPRPQPVDRAACEKGCRRDGFAPLCARLGDGSSQAFENACMFGCYAAAEGDHSARVVARHIQLPAKCANQWAAVGFMVNWCKECPASKGSRRMMRERALGGGDGEQPAGIPDGIIIGSEPEGEEPAGIIIHDERLPADFERELTVDAHGRLQFVIGGTADEHAD